MAGGRALEASGRGGGKRRLRAALAALGLAAALCLIGRTLELLSGDLAGKRFWDNVAYVGIAAIPVAWLVFTLHCTGRERLLTRPRLALLLLEPAAAVGLAWTRGHSQFRAGLHVETVGPLRILHWEPGPAFWVHNVYSYLVLLLAAAFLLQSVLTGTRIGRRQGLFLLAGSLVPLTTNAAYLAGVSPLGLDLTPLALVLGVLPLAWAVYQHRLLDVVPLARDLVVTAMGEGVVVLDRGQRVVDLNPAARDLLALREARAIGALLEEVFPRAPELLAAPRAEIEVELETRDGPRRVEARLVLPRRDDVVESGGVLMLRDVTESRRTQAELFRLQGERARESEEQFRILFERSPDGILVVDAGDQRILKANRACRALLGRTQEDLVGSSLHGLWRQEDEGQAFARPERPEDLLARAAAQGASSGLASVRRPDGTSLPVGFSGTAFPWGAATALLVTLRDVSDRMKADEERARLEATLRSVAAEWANTFDVIPVGILLVDGDGRVRRLNDAARAMAGGPRFEELLGRPLREVAAGEPWPTAALAASAVGTHGDAALRQAIDEDSGRAFAVGASRLPRPRPEPPWTIVTLKETTRLVAMQDALRRSESMAALGALVAGVAHEVRSPLFAISTTVELLEEEAGGAETRRESIGMLREAVGRLSALMEDLIEYGRPIVQPHVEARFETAVYTAIRECEQLARAASVTVASRCPGVLPPVVMDERGVVRALQNVVQNAIQHSPPGGAVEVDLSADERWAVCTVHDSGGGFTAEDLRRVFTPFFSRRRGGTGLGLAIVRRLMEEHGGQVFAHNHPQGGGMVSVRIPHALPER